MSPLNDEKAGIHREDVGTSSDSYDVIIIGSGMGGLTAASLLARFGERRVLVLERHFKLGGLTHTFTRNGYEWDVGVHYVGELNQPDSPTRELFDVLTDGQLKWADMGDVYDKVIIGDDAYEFIKGREAFRNRMHQYFPNERGAIDRYLELVLQVGTQTGQFFGEKAMPKPLSSTLGRLMRWRGERLARHTTRHTLESLTQNRRLIGVLTGQYADYGLPPGQSSFFVHALIAGHYLEGAAYPVGGAGRIASSIIPGIEQRGGTLRTNAEVEAILVEQGRAIGVRMTDGQELLAPVIISDTGVSSTLGNLLPPAERRRRGFEGILKRHAPSTGHLGLYLGLEGSAQELGLSRTNLWIYPDHEHDELQTRFRRDPSRPPPLAFVSFPSAKDPDFLRRYPDRATVEVVTLVPYQWFRRWENQSPGNRGSEYESFKGELTERLLAVVYDKLPTLQGKVAHCELSTPLSTKTFTASPRGSMYGLAATPDFFLDRSLRPATPLAGLYLSGSDMTTPGVVGAMYGGYLAASAVLGKNLISIVSQGNKKRSLRQAA